MKMNLNLAIFWSKSVSLTIGFGLIIIVLLIYIFAPKNIVKEDSGILIGMSIDSEERVDKLVKTNVLTLMMEDGNRIMVSIPKSAQVRLGADVEVLKVKLEHKNDYRYEFSKYVN